jgi:hypothetical protein
MFPHTTSISRPSFAVLTTVFHTIRFTWGVTQCTWVMLLDVSEDRTEGPEVT